MFSVIELLSWMAASSNAPRDEVMAVIDGAFPQDMKNMKTFEERLGYVTMNFPLVFDHPDLQEFLARCCRGEFKDKVSQLLLYPFLRVRPRCVKGFSLIGDHLPVVCSFITV